MSWALRGLLGALVAALFLPFLVPQVRVQLRQGMTTFGPPVSLETLQLSTDLSAPIGDPTDSISAGLWLRRYAQAVANHQPVSLDNHRLMAEIAQAAGQGDPGNAFWPHVEAMGQEAIGNRAQAEDALQRASKCQRWTDYQRHNLLEAISQLRSRHGREMAWHYAALAEWRNDATPEAMAAIFLEQASNRSLLAEAKPGFELMFRAQTTADGRDAAARLVAASSGKTSSRLVDDFDRTAYWKKLRLLTVFSATAPGSLTLTVFCFLFVLAVAVLWARSPILVETLSGKTSLITAVCVSVVIYVLTRMVMPSLLAALSLAAFGFDSTNQPFFVRWGRKAMNFVHQIVGGVFGALLLAAAISSATTAAQAVRATPQAEWPALLTPYPLFGAFIGLAFVWLAFVPAVAAAHGRPSEDMVAPALRRLAVTALITAAVLAVVCTPFCIWLERHLLLEADQHFWFG